MNGKRKVSQRALQTLRAALVLYGADYDKFSECMRAAKVPSYVQNLVVRYSDSDSDAAYVADEMVSGAGYVE